MPALVHYHKLFYEGKKRTNFFSDFTELLPHELEVLFSFIAKVKSGQPIEGKNKTSWTDENGQEINSVTFTSYKTCKLWHCHVGPFTAVPYKAQENIRVLNLKGKTSSAIVHYKWYDVERTKLIIIAFSPKHKPYPKPDHEDNPLPQRGGLILSNNLVDA